MDSLQDEPMQSFLANDESLKELIHAFVADMPVKTKAIQEALSQGNRTALSRLARALNEQGGSYGFEAITKAAEKVETAICEGDEKNIKFKAEELMKLGALIRGPA